MSMDVSKKFLSISERDELFNNILQDGTSLLPGSELWNAENQCVVKEKVETTGGKVKYLGGGVTANVYELCMDETCNFTIALRTVDYDYEESISDIKDPSKAENVEVNVFKLLNRLLLSGSTPHIPLYGGNFFCEDASTGLEQQYILAEKADMNLRNLLVKVFEGTYNPPDADLFLCVLFFQIIFTLATIQEVYNGYRHNDLHFENILVFLDKTQINKPADFSNVYKYVFKGETFYLPNVGVQLAIWDYDFNSIFGIVDNSKLPVYDKRLNLSGFKNNYFDLFVIMEYLDYLIRKELKEIVESEEDLISEFPLTYQFIKYVLPEYKDTVSYERRLSLDFEWTTPNKCLQHPSLSIFRNNPLSTYSIIETYDYDYNSKYISPVIESTEIIQDCDILNSRKIPYYVYRDDRFNNSLRANECYNTKNNMSTLFSIS
jgi:hypothetical protein